MHSSFQKMLKGGLKAVLPLLSISLLNLSHQKILNATPEEIQSKPVKLNAKQTAQKLSKKHQGWDWDRIIQINTPQQLSPNDILQKTIICYQMTGNVEVDSQVALISHLFCDKFFGKISQRFQFIFLTPNPNFHSDEQFFYAVFGKQGTKYVSLKKYVNNHSTTRKFLPNYHPLFDRLLSEVNKYQQISLNNIHEHLQHLGCEGRDTYQLVVVPEDNTQKQINKSKRTMQRFLKNRQIWNSQINKIIVTDKQSQTLMGLNKTQIQTNKVYLISPKNQNLLNIPNETFKIQNKSYTIIPHEKIQKQFIFPPIPPKLSQQSYILKFNVDLNQTRPELVSEIYEMMKDQKLVSQIGQKIPKLMSFSSNDESIQITIQKNNHDNIVHVYEPGCMYEQTQKRHLLTQTNLWKYPHQVLDPEKLKQFVNAVVNTQNSPQSQKNKSQYEYFKTEPESQSQRKNSKLIVGEQRKDVINRNQDKVMFHFSKSCHSCKRFGGAFQQIAQQMRQVRFYRTDNDTNKTQGLKNYNSTPIFVMYKKGYSELPWYYKMPYFTKKLFSNFVDITREVNIMDSQKFKNHLKEHMDNQSLVKETLKEFI